MLAKSVADDDAGIKNRHGLWREIEDASVKIYTGGPGDPRESVAAI